ncbi:cytochrome c [Lacihabitans sp. LS3-19]|uniref:c-type cytochrome n=1 Tax=Lacihabitans sp. LS3-19 TaxID=2487335 RepID=UPI0020CCAAC9|nr:cytochrome c [Lacihabitans sp. LS3-19]
MLSVLPIIIWSCGGAEKRAETPKTDESVLLKQDEVHGQEVKELALSTPLDQTMVKAGQEIYDVKCASCHRLTEEKLVGPGWKNVTTRRKPVWIVNMITNVDMMLADDAEAQKMLEECLVRMPNQNITSDEARSVIEYMRHNDGEK